MARSNTSLRLDDDLRAGLARLARFQGTTLTAVVERLLREALAMAEHPGIVFKPGPSGPRAALAGGPDAWEIASALRHTVGAEADRVAALAQEFSIAPRQVLVALDYIAAHYDEVEARVRANDHALERAERVAHGRQRLLA
jgi:hypothetical protein